MEHLDAIDIHKQFLEGKISAEEITLSFLKRTQELDKHIGAFTSRCDERALARAKELDQKKKRGEKMGKLAGIPIGIKDNIHVKGEISTCGSKFLTNYKAPFSAVAVQHLQAEDAILMGKTNCDEFAMGSSTEKSAIQKTYNPWNLNCVPGGSSGGSAAAVAARLCPIALGSDTGGSIRQPASLCGIVGFKPTYGRVSRYGLVAYGSSLDQIGPLTTSVRDAALTMEIIGKPCHLDSTSLQEASHISVEGLNKPLPAPLRIGVPYQFLQGLNPEAKETFENSLQVLKSKGATIVEVDLSILEHAIATYTIIAFAEASTNLAKFDGIRYGNRSKRAKNLQEVYMYSKEEGYGEEVKRRILIGTFVLSAGYQDAYYRKAQKVRTKIIQSYAKAFETCDLIATPVSPFVAFEMGSIQDPLQMYFQDVYTVSINLAGLPAISVPAGFSKNGLPIGFQLIGPQKQDNRVLHVAEHFERATRFNTKLPSLVTKGVHHG